MKLIHFSKSRLSGALKNYAQSSQAGPKPKGLWVSDETEFGWKTWCTGERFNLENLRYPHEIVLKKDARVLLIKNSEEMYQFHEKYKGDVYPGFPMVMIDWSKVAKDFDGIVITPYLWERRLDHHVNWYYGWDCASGCIWNTSVIETITELKEIDVSSLTKDHGGTQTSSMGSYFHSTHGSNKNNQNNHNHRSKI